MDEKANFQTAIIEKDLDKLSTRFDRHLEIYAQNGKELAALKASVDGLKAYIEQQHSRDSGEAERIWTQTKKNTNDISDIKVALGKVLVKVAAISSIAASISASIAAIVVERFLF